MEQASAGAGGRGSGTVRLGDEKRGAAGQQNEQTYEDGNEKKRVESLCPLSLLLFLLLMLLLLLPLGRIGCRPVAVRPVEKSLVAISFLFFVSPYFFKAKLITKKVNKNSGNDRIRSQRRLSKHYQQQQSCYTIEQCKRL